MTPIKPHISFSVGLIGLGYNTFLLYPRTITLAKDICGFIGVMGLKTGKFFIFNIYSFYTASVVLMLVSIS